MIELTTDEPNKHLFIANMFKPLITLVAVVAAIFLFAVSPAAADNSPLPILPYINQLRAQTGAGPLSYSNSLSQQSWNNAHALVTQNNCQLQHLGGDGGSRAEALYAASPGSNWFQESKDAIDDWQSEGPSPDLNHYNIMHDPQYTAIGCGTEVADANNHANGCFVTACNFN
jgi:uncharacterized protein YkwD